MEYTSTKIEGHPLMYRIETAYNDTSIHFNVVCGVDDSEIPDLVAHHIEYLDSLKTTDQIEE